MSQPAANTSSLSTRLSLYRGPPTINLAIGITPLKVALLTPLAFLPAAILGRIYNKSYSEDPSRRGNPGAIISTLCLSGTVGVATAAASQVIIGYSAAAILFGNGDTRDYFVRGVLLASVDGLSPEDVARRASIAWSWQNTAFNAIFSFLAAAVTEETLKYLPVAYSRRSLRKADKQTRQRSRAPFDYALAWSLGLGLVETIGGIHTAGNDPKATWAKVALTVFERVVLGASAHLITAALTALRSIRRDQTSGDTFADRSFLTFCSIVGPSVFLHGANNFGLFSFSAWNGNIGFIHPTSLTQNLAMLSMYSVALGTTAWLARREWKENDKKQR
jgi:RsiW-degrading membrane proteinase PrsW (M82 family)